MGNRRNLRNLWLGSAIRVFRVPVFVALAVLLAGSGCPRPKQSPQPWLTRHAHWPDGEVSRYDVLRADTVVGQAIIRVRHDREQGQPAYAVISVNSSVTPGRLEGQVSNLPLLLHDSIAAWLTADSLKPLRSFQIRNLLNRQDTVVSIYQAGKVTVTANGSFTGTLAAPENTFDNSILVMAIRSLELAPGAHYALTSLAAFGPWTKPADVDVEGEELVTVPAGTFACYKLNLEIAGYALNLWYEKAEPRRYVRFENRSNNSVAVLTGYETDR